jgi:hypothetical protein
MRIRSCYINISSRDNSVGIATGYRLDDRGSILGRGKKCSLLHSVQTGFGAHSASYLKGTRSFSPGVKRAAGETGLSSPSSAEVKKNGAILPLSLYVFMAWCLIN